MLANIFEKLFFLCLLFIFFCNISYQIDEGFDLQLMQMHSAQINE